jgi:hypothetical protein
MQIFDNDLGFKIDLVIILAAKAVFIFLAVLAHHDDGSLHGGHAGKEKIEQYNRQVYNRFVSLRLKFEIVFFKGRQGGHAHRHALERIVAVFSA